MYEVPIGWLRHVVNALGADSAVLRSALRASGLQLNLLTNGAERIPARRYGNFLEHTAQLAGDDAFGLHLGRSYDIRTTGLAAYVPISSATLREAMQNTVRYGALEDTSADYGFEEAGNAARFRFDCRDAYMRSHRQATEFKAALVVAACRHWVQRGFRPQEMRFAHPRVSSLQAFRRFFGCPVHFGAEATEMLLSAEQLPLPMRRADPHLLALLTRRGDELLAARGHQPDGLRSRVERLVLERLPKGTPTAGEIAGALGIGERTFSRRLADEGAPYRRLVEELRCHAAKSYLRDRGLTLAQIAYLLGYAEQSAFTTAFRRWTGQSPGRYRAAM